MDLWNGEYYPGIDFEGSTLLFGANVLQDHDVLFSWEDMRVGFAKVTNCQWDGTTSEIDISAPVPAPTYLGEPTVMPTARFTSAVPTQPDPSPAPTALELPTPNPAPPSLSPEVQPTNHPTANTFATITIPPSTTPSLLPSATPTADKFIPTMPPSAVPSLSSSSHPTVAPTLSQIGTNKKKSRAFGATTSAFLVIYLLLCVFFLTVLYVWIRKHKVLSKWGPVQEDDNEIDDSVPDFVQSPFTSGRHDYDEDETEVELPTMRHNHDEGDDGSDFEDEEFASDEDYDHEKLPRLAIL